MTSARADLKTLIAARMAQAGSGAVWTPADFLDLGGRDAVDKALQRMVKAGELRRIDRGLYDQPSHNSLTRQVNAPKARSVIDAVARRDQIRVLVDGMTAANDLGLTNAVPAKILVHTDARLRPIHLGAMTLDFRLTAPSKLYWAGRPAMRIIQALHWLRDTLSDDAERDSVLRRLRRLLDDPVQGPGLRADLDAGLPTLPSWMQDMVRTLLKDAPCP